MADTLISIVKLVDAGKSKAIAEPVVALDVVFTYFFIEQRHGPVNKAVDPPELNGRYVRS